MSSVSNINAPIRILLLGSDTEVGSSLLQLSKENDGFEWLCPKEADLLGGNAKKLLSSMEFDVSIDAFSLRYSLQNDGEEFGSVLRYLSEEVSAPLFMVSSSRVFSGKKEIAYDEDDVPDSTDPYGLALVEFESIVLNNPKNLVLRTGWLFSGQGDDFVCRTLRQIQSGASLSYKDDFIGCPTPISDIVRVILSMVNQGYYGAKNTGIYHYCCAEEISWTGLVEAIVATSGQIDPNNIHLEVNVISDDSNGIEKNVLRQSLSCRKVFNNFGIKQRPWRLKLRDLVKTLYK